MLKQIKFQTISLIKTFIVKRKMIKLDRTIAVKDVEVS
jgi:hypothetical protein